MSITESILSFPLAQPWQKSSLSCNIDFDHDLNLIHDGFEATADDDLLLVIPELVSASVTENVEILSDNHVDTVLPQVEDEARPDVWQQDFGEDALKGTSSLLGWREDTRSTALYTTDLSSSSFDAFLRQRRPHAGLLPQDVGLRSLCSLALGWSSTHYPWNERTSRFEPILKDVAIAGCTASVSSAIVARALDVGGHSRRLRNATTMMHLSDTLSAVRVAYNRCLSAVLDELEASLTHTLSSVRTLIQFDAKIERVFPLLALCARVDAAVKQTQDDNALLLHLSQQHDKLSSIGDKHAAVIRSLLQATALPYVKQILAAVGLSIDGTAHDNAHTQAVLNLVIATGASNAVLGPESVQSIESGVSERQLIEDHLPQHPLCIAQRLSAPESGPVDVDGILERATRLQVRLEEAVAAYTSNKTTRVPDEAYTTLSFELFTSEPSGPGHEQSGSSLDQDLLLPDSSLLAMGASLADNQSDVHRAVNHILQGQEIDHSLTTIDTHGPSSAVGQLATLLERQDRLYRHAVLSLFLDDYKLKDVLVTCQMHFMLQDADFTQRLRSAIFDDRLDEQQHSFVRRDRTPGLCLNARKKVVWPPSSSHLSLSLAGVLDQDLGNPVSFSFAVRELDEDQIENVCRAESVHALDFLQLNCVVPGPLNQFWTSKAVKWYEEIFACLLLHTRVLHLVTGLRSAFLQRRHPQHAGSRHALCLHNIHHLVSTMAAYAHDASTRPWQRFMAILKQAEISLTHQHAQTRTTKVSRHALHVEQMQYLAHTRKQMFIGRRYHAIDSSYHDLYAAILEHADSLRQTSPTADLDHIGTTITSIASRLKDSLSHLKDKLQASSDPEDEAEATMVDRLLCSLQ